MIHCPVGGEEMKPAQRHDVTVDVCAEHGMWLDRTELLTITEWERHHHASWSLADLFRRKQRPPNDEGRVLNCPHCQKPMRPYDYHDVTIDWCEEHGIWLDCYELDAILNNLRLDPFYVGKVALRLTDMKF